MPPLDFSNPGGVGTPAPFRVAPGEGVSGFGTANPSPAIYLPPQGFGSHNDPGPQYPYDPPTAPGSSYGLGANVPKPVTPVGTPGPNAMSLQAAWDAFHPQPDPMTQAMQQYAAQFGASQQAQQSAINAGLASAMANLGQRRDAVAKVAAGLPAQVTQAYNTAQGSQNAANASLAALGGGASRGGGGIDPAVGKLINGQLAGGQAAGLASVPLINAGITADYTKGADTLENQHLAAQDAINQRAADFALKMAELTASHADSQSKLADEEKLAAFTNSLPVSPTKAAELAAGQTNLQQKIQEQEAADLEKRYAAVGMTTAQGQAATNDPYYNAVVAALGGGKGNLPNGIQISRNGSQADFLKQVARSNSNTLAALLANGKITQTDYQAALSP